MKKYLIISIIISLFLIGSVSAQKITIKYGDTLHQIARDYGTTIFQLQKDNNIENPNLIYAGDTLSVPDGQDQLGYSVVTGYQKSLRSSITATQTTIPVTSLELRDGTIIDINSFGGKVFLSIEPGKTKEELVVCTNIATSTLNFTNCTRGLAFSGNSESAVSANQKTHNAGSIVTISNVHYVYEQFVDVNNKTQTIQGDRTATGTWTFATNSLYLGNNTTTINKKIYANNGTSNEPFIQYNEATGGWQISNDGLNTLNLVSSTGTGLSASTTRGIGITNSLIHVNASTTLGTTFDAAGNLYQAVSSTKGLAQDANGIYIKNDTSTILFDGSGNIRANATSTVRTPSVMPIADASGLITDWVATSSLNVQPYVAGQNINASSAPIAVYANTTDGKVYMTSSTFASEAVFNFIGFALKGQNVTTGTNINIQTDGIVDGFTSLTVGRNYFVSNTPGIIDTVTGTTAYRIGRSITTTTLKISPGEKSAHGLTTFASSASTAITVGFRPSRVIIFGTAGGAHTTGGWTENSGNACVGTTAAGGSTSDGTQSWNLQENTNTNAGNVNTITDTGFTLTNTKTNSPNSATILWIAEG